MNKSREETLDKIARLVCEDKQKEIEELRAYIAQTSKEARGLAYKYSLMGGYDYSDVDDMPHELFDFLQSI